MRKGLTARHRARLAKGKRFRKRRERIHAERRKAKEIRGFDGELLPNQRP